MREKIAEILTEYGSFSTLTHFTNRYIRYRFIYGDNALTANASLAFCAMLNQIIAQFCLKVDQMFHCGRHFLQLKYIKLFGNISSISLSSNATNNLSKAMIICYGHCQIIYSAGKLISSDSIITVLKCRGNQRILKIRMTSLLRCTLLTSRQQRLFADAVNNIADRYP